MKLSSEELRLGNYVLDNFDVHNPYKLTKISIDDFVAIGHGCNSYQPIQITEGVLLKCGKEVDMDDNDGIKWFSLNDSDVIQLLPDGRVLYESTFVESLHELQNCFYWKLNRKEELNVEL